MSTHSAVEAAFVVLFLVAISAGLVRSQSQ